VARGPSVHPLRLEAPMTSALANLQAIATQGAIFWLPYTLALYPALCCCSAAATSHPLLNPTLLTIAGVAAMLFCADIPYPRYFESVTVLNDLWAQRSWRAGRSRAAQSGGLKGREGRFCALVAGSLVSILAGLAIAGNRRPADPRSFSLAPKSATAASRWRSRG